MKDLSNKLNSENIFLFTPIMGLHEGKNYLFIESNKRYSLLRAYVNKRPDRFKQEKYFLVTGVKPDMTWEFGNYSNAKVYTKNVPLPELIYDIQKDKVYELKGQLWNFK